MIHQPYGQVGGQVSDIEIQAEEIVRSKQVINEILAKHTGQPIERIAKDTERDRYLTAIQAKEYGLVDEVVGRMTGRERHAGIRHLSRLANDRIRPVSHASHGRSTAAQRHPRSATLQIRTARGRRLLFRRANPSCH